MIKYRIAIALILPFVLFTTLAAFYVISPSDVQASANNPVGLSQNLAGQPFHNPEFYGSSADKFLTYVPKTVSAAEFKCLAQAVYFEARSEPFEGQVAVAYVVMNRVDKRHYPDSICGVVFQNEKKRHRCQFSFACDGLSDKPYEITAWATALQVASAVLANRHSDVTDQSTHYHAVYVNPYWAASMQPTLQVGDHIFYREDS